MLQEDPCCRAMQIVAGYPFYTIVRLIHYGKPSAVACRKIIALHLPCVCYFRLFFAMSRSAKVRFIVFGASSISLTLSQSNQCSYSTIVMCSSSCWLKLWPASPTSRQRWKRQVVGRSTRCGPRWEMNVSLLCVSFTAVYLLYNAHHEPSGSRLPIYHLQKGWMLSDKWMTGEWQMDDDEWQVQGNQPSVPPHLTDHT